MGEAVRNPRLEQAFEPRLATAQRPALAQYLSLLVVPAADVEAIIQRALDSNPMLTRTPGGPCHGCGRHCATAGYCRSCSSARVSVDTPNATDWRAELECDARLELPAALHTLLSDVVSSLDDHGLLRAEAMSPSWPAAGLARVMTAIRLVGPPGIAAASPLGCVQLQVRALVEAGVAPPLAATIVEEHLAQVADGDLPGLAELLRVGIDEIAEALAVVSDRVRPYVVLSGPVERARPVDVIFRRDSDQPTGIAVDVLDSQWLGLQLDEDLWSSATGEARAWLRTHRVEAQQLLAELGARSGMLRRLGDLLAQRQRAFLLGGPADHQALTRAEAARQLGCHPSTVGRIVQATWARCPDGRIIALADCFGGRTAALEAVRRVVAGRPGLSAEAIRSELAAGGIRLARRTVAQYRGLLAAAGLAT